MSDSCTLCGASIRWVTTVGDRRMPLDLEPAEDGNVVPVVVDGKQRARVLTGPELPAQEPAWRSHHSTCPHAADARRRKAITAPRCRYCSGRLHQLLIDDGIDVHPLCGHPGPGELRAVVEASRVVAS